MMKKITLFAFSLTAVFMFSCTHQPSLERYFVEKMEDSSFLFLNIPIDFKTFFSDEKELTNEEVAALSNVHKMNILIFRGTEENQQKLSKETKAVTAILNNPKFESLLSFGVKEGKGAVYLLGSTNDIDEGIVWVHHPTEGLAIVRVLGDDMNPGMLLKTVRKIDKNSFSERFKGQFGSLFETLKGLQETTEDTVD